MSDETGLVNCCVMTEPSHNELFEYLNGHVRAGFRYHVVCAFKQFAERVNIVAVFDHSRAGNTFFTAIFDQHPQVIVCAWTHYLYSYLVSAFADQRELDSRAAHEFATQIWYFRLVYDDPSAANEAFIDKIGADPKAPIDRGHLRRVFDEIVLSRPTISRRDLALACYFAFATGIQRDVERIKFVLIDDAVTLGSETRFTGYSGRVIDAVAQDFPDARMVHLVRDVRAALASINHQFVNTLGNAYGIHLGNYRKFLRRLFTIEFGWDGVSILGFCLMLLHQSFLTIERKKLQYAGHFVTVKNEELNVRFTETMRTICQDLGIEYLDIWNAAKYSPTMLGRPWRGLGAYNNRYQKRRYGPLENEPDSISNSIAGPNKYVTERWRSRLSAREIFIVEWFLRSELRLYGYPFAELRSGQEGMLSLIRRLALPLRGELPTISWIRNGARLGARELGDRLFFAVAFLPFYLGVRLDMLRLVHRPVFLER